MDKSDLIKAIAESADISEVVAKKVLEVIIEEIATSLKEGDQVSLVGFGTFSVRNRAERTGRNPQTGQTIQIKSAKIPAFKAGRALKLSVDPGTDDPGPSIKKY